jgi:hypothetical protein
MTHPTRSAVDIAPAGPAASLKSLDRRTLQIIFQRPLSHSLSWREVVALLTSIGQVEDKANGQVLFHAGDANLSMEKPRRKSVAASEVIDLRHFLTRAGWSPEAAETTPAPAPPGRSEVVVVIDHTGARIFELDGADPETPRHPASSRHVPRHDGQRARDADRDETDPEDERFFEAIASHLTRGGDIVLIGHGKGQSNEADHLGAYLGANHKDIHARITRRIVADLAHSTLPELLDLARAALA